MYSFKDYITEYKSGKDILVKVKNIKIGTKVQYSPEDASNIIFTEEKSKYIGKTINVQQMHITPDFYAGNGMLFHKSWLDFNPANELDLDI